MTQFVPLPGIGGFIGSGIGGGYIEILDTSEAIGTTAGTSDATAVSIVDIAVVGTVAGASTASAVFAGDVLAAGSAAGVSAVLAARALDFSARGAVTGTSSVVGTGLRTTQQIRRTISTIGSGRASVTANSGRATAGIVNGRAQSTIGTAA